MTAAAVKYANLEKYVYWLLLATIAVIPLQQEVSSAMVAVTGFSGFIVAFLRRHEKRKPVLPRFVQILYGYCYYLVIGRCIIQLMRYCLPTILFMLSVNTRYWSG